MQNPRSLLDNFDEKGFEVSPKLKASSILFGHKKRRKRKRMVFVDEEGKKKPEALKMKAIGCANLLIYKIKDR